MFDRTMRILQIGHAETAATNLKEILAADQIGVPILSLLIFIPLAGALVIWMLKDTAGIRWTALGTVLLTFALALALLPFFATGVADMQFVERRNWIPVIGISYHLGIDGISIFLVMLTAFLSVLIVLFSWEAIRENLREYMVCLLALQVTLTGVFCALDLVLFFLFWEVLLLPMYFLIKSWGGPNRDYAALKFVLYTLTGSVLMLVGFIILYLNYQEMAFRQGFSKALSFDFLDLLKTPLSFKKQIAVFLLLFFGFAFKVPMFPFHTWLPDAHVEAPTAGSVILAGVLLKMGTYGFLRFSLPLLPEASRYFAPMMAGLAIVGILYGALLALAQHDLKKLIAYSSISHLGFVMLGLFTLNHQGLQGGLLQMLNHGISTGGLFLIAGFLYERRHTRMITEFGGLSQTIPVFATFYFIITLSSLGLPGTNGFVGEFLILTGAFQARWQYAAFAAVGVLLTASYLLWLYQRVMYGQVTNPKNLVLNDLNFREIAICSALVVVIFLVGIYPRPFLARMEPSIEWVLARIGPETAIVQRERPGRQDGLVRKAIEPPRRQGLPADRRADQAVRATIGSIRSGEG